MSTSTSPSIPTLIERAGQLYSPPAVAMEIVRLTSEPQIDASAIRDCLAGDPALTAKLLRVVNSSIYGLKGQVADLTQAVALVGVRPLKLLVLGFSLPDDLFEQIDPETLVDYWTRTVTRSIAAKELAESFGPNAEWQAIADEALVAGLLEGVGQLVLLSELRDAYNAVLRRIDAEPRGATLAVAEQRALGFDHRELSAELLRSWNLPERLAEAIERQTLDKPIGRTEPLAAVLELADLTTSLVVDRRLNALPRLLERGQRLCGLKRSDVQLLVERVQPKADQLAEALGVELRHDADYSETLVAAHRLLADASEGAAARLLGADPDPIDAADEAFCRELLEEVGGLATSMRDYLEADEPTRPAQPTQTTPLGHAHAARADVRPPHHTAAEAIANQITLLVSQHAEACRANRQPLALALVQLDRDDPQAMAGFRRWWKGRDDAASAAAWVVVSTNRLGVLMPGIDRRDAVAIWNEAIADYGAGGGSIDVGVAGVVIISKGFAAESLIGPAERCLDAAVSSGLPTVKSIEVY